MAATLSRFAATSVREGGDGLACFFFPAVGPAVPSVVPFVSSGPPLNSWPIIRKNCFCNSSGARRMGS